MPKRQRKYFSEKIELINKSRESALAAIQIFNNPLITFKSESFIVLMIIAWTYLLHAYYIQKKIDYRERDKNGRLLKTKYGAYRLWGLEKCLDANECPLEEAVKDNLKFLLGLRHEIEHQMTKSIDEHISGKFQANCINYNQALKKLFERYSKDFEKSIPISLQLFSFGESQINSIKNKPDLPKNLIEFITNFEGKISTLENPLYSYRVIYLRDNASRESTSDVAYRFLSEGSTEGKKIHNILIKNKKLKKLMAKEVVKIIQKTGFPKFTNYSHQSFWKTRWKSVDARNKSSDAEQFGEMVTDSQWMWYEETWIPEVKRYCQENSQEFK